MRKLEILQNPFLHRREVHRSSNASETGTTAAQSNRKLYSRSGRSNSAPDSYVFSEIPADPALEAVKEVTLDQTGQKSVENSKQHKSR